MIKNELRLRIGILVAVLVGILFVVQMVNARPFWRKDIKVSGNIEATEVRLSFRVNGQIEKLYVDEGYVIKPGDLVAKLKRDELSRIKLENAAALKSAEHEFILARDDYRRAENLFKEGSMSAQARDNARTKYNSLNAKTDQLRASLKLADTRLSFTELISPLNAFVLTKSAEAGEVVQPGATIFDVADLTDIWLTAYVNETDLARVKLDQEVSVKTDTFPNKVYKGRISYISEEAEFTPKQIQTTEERVKLVYRIKVRINNQDLELKPGMPADGYICLK